MPNSRQFSKNVFETRLNRFLVVLLVLVLCGSAVVARRDIANLAKPGDWYFYTTANPAASLDHRYRTPEEPGCTLNRITSLANQKINPPGISYKNIYLCNEAAFPNEKFSVVTAQFIEAVHKLYADYYWAIIASVFHRLLCGIFMWGIAVLFAFTVRWIIGQAKSATK